MAPAAFTGVSTAATTTSLEVACPADEVPGVPFPDVAADSVHRLPVACLAWDRHGVVRGRGDGTYGPAAPVTRGQMAGFVSRLLRAAGVALAERPANRFADDDGSVFALAIDQLAELGVVRGVGGDRYAPEAPVSRAQMATYLVEAHYAATGDWGADTPDRFADDQGSVHESNANRAAHLGLTTGVSATSYAPAAPVRRDQMASFLARLLDRLLVDGILGEPERTEAGFVFWNGEYVAPPYTVEATSTSILVNGVAVQSALTAPATPEPVPAEPADAAELVAAGAARLQELGDTGPVLPDPAVVAEVLAHLRSFAAAQDVRVEDDRILVTDAEGDSAQLLLTRQLAGTPEQHRRSLQRTAHEWSTLLQEGGALLLLDGQHLSVPAQGVADVLWRLVDAYDVPEQDRHDVLVEVLGTEALADAAMGAGSPREDLGERMPQRAEPASQASASSSVLRPGDDDLTLRRSLALSPGPHHRAASRTPTGDRLYSFTTLDAEYPGACHRAPIEKAARLHGYPANVITNSVGALGALSASSGRAGLMYVCMHGGDAFEVYLTRTEALAWRAAYVARGFTAPDLATGPGKDIAGRPITLWYLVANLPFLATEWREAGTILWSDGCSAWRLRAMFDTREYIAADQACFTHHHNGYMRDFWARVDGTASSGRARNVGDAYTETFGAGTPVAIAPPPGFPGSVPYTFRHGGYGRGATVISPAVVSVSPSDGAVLQVGAPGSVRGRVVFDATMDLLARDVLLVSGCLRLESWSWDTVRSLRFTASAQAPGTATLTLLPPGTFFGVGARSGDNEVGLDGNTDPGGSDHVGPNGDAYTWTVRCVGGIEPPPTEPPPTTPPPTEPPPTSPPPTEPPPTTPPPTTPPPSPSPSPSSPSPPTPPPSPVADRTLEVEVRSLNPELGPLDPAAVTVDPAKAAYTAGEDVVLTAVQQFDSGGYRHFFADWVLDPDRGLDFAASGNVLRVSMDVPTLTVTARYESTPIP